MPQPRGRKSVYALQTLPIIPGERPAPLPELNHEQQKVWRKIVNRMPADWFTDETFHLLAQLCRHICNLREIAHLIDAFDVTSLRDLNNSRAFKNYEKLLKLHDDEGKSMLQLSCKMRLTQLSRYSAASAATAVKATAIRKPWEKAA